jgi:hypothetical protein
MVLYDFTVLRVEEMLPGGWRVIADSKDLQHFATEEDANRGLASVRLVGRVRHDRLLHPGPHGWTGAHYLQPL